MQMGVARPARQFWLGRVLLDDATASMRLGPHHTYQVDTQVCAYNSEYALTVKIVQEG